MAVNISTSTTPPSVSNQIMDSSGDLDPEFVRVFELVFDDCINSALAYLGLVTNIVNIIIFNKQGYQDSVNITMTTIAFWDVIKCISGAITRLRFLISMFSASFAVTWFAVHYPKTVYIQIIAGYVTYPIAAYVAVERALCVCKPFTFKQVATRKVTSVFMISISIGVFTMFVPCLLMFDFAMEFSSEYNTTVGRYLYSDFANVHGDTYMPFYHYIGIINPVLSLVVIVISTTICVYRLRQSSENVKKMSAGGQASNSNTLSTRERQVVRMLLVIIMMFVVNLIPRVTHQLAKAIEPKYYLLREYHGIFMVCAVTLFSFDFFNSSSNFFIFLLMSSSFRKTFYGIFSTKETKTK